VTTIEFLCNGAPVESDLEPGESLLSVLRERLGITSVKDGCAPQGQCGCCTVLIDGAPRVACVTPAARVAGRSVTTIEGLDSAVRDRATDALCATGGAQCGFCTPGIVVRCAALIAEGAADRSHLDRSLAAHLCRCTGWQTIVEAFTAPTAGADRDLVAAARRATLEGGVAQQVGAHVSLGAVSFADDAAPPDALVAVPLPEGSDRDFVDAAGIRFVVAESVHAARTAAGKTQGRRTTLAVSPPLPLPARPDGGVRLATSWVEPAYLESDASWCVPGGEPASSLANGGAFGGKSTSIVPAAARELADRFDRPVRVLYSREDVVRFGAKRPPIAATARLEDRTIILEVVAAGELAIAEPAHYGLAIDVARREVAIAGPPVGSLRAPWAESAVLVEGALHAVGFDREANVHDDVAAVLLDTCVASPDGAFAGARVALDDQGRLSHVDVRVMAGDPLDETVLRSYCIGAAHMALGWVLTEGLTVDRETGEIQDLTIRSFGIIRPKDMPQVDVEVIDDPRAPIAKASDAVFAAVAAATWIALDLPETWPALHTPTAKQVRR
jgi:aerobic-type carbon monoxide dehydrogenase small subunit (CoxS/CutS family)